MANSYFNWPGNVNRFVPLDTARAEDVNYALDELSSGLDQVEADIGASIKVAITSTDQIITAGPVARADKLVAFDEDGNVTVTDDTVTSIAVNAAAAEVDAATASAQAGIATTKAGEAAASASSASTSASTATTQAGIATTKAGEAAASAAEAAATVTSKVSKTGDTINGNLVIAPSGIPFGNYTTTTLSSAGMVVNYTEATSTTQYTIDLGDKPSASLQYGRLWVKPNLWASNGLLLNGGITADTSEINIGGGQIVKDTSGNVTFGAGAFGYGAGAGGTVTQGVSKTEPVTVTPATPTWLLTTHGAELTSGAVIDFPVYNSLIGANDIVVLAMVGGIAYGKSYNIWVGSVAAGVVYVAIKNISGGNLSEAIQIRMAIIRGSNS